MNVFTELSQLNEEDRDREKLGYEPFDPFLLKKKIVETVKKIYPKLKEKRDGK